MHEQIKKQILEELSKGNHILLKGIHGVGKTHLALELQKPYIDKTAKEVWFYFPSCRTYSQIIAEILKGIAWEPKHNEELRKALRRPAIRIAKEEIPNFLDKEQKKIVVILDDTHAIPVLTAHVFHILIECERVTIFAIANSNYLDKRMKSPRCKRFFWELKHIELPPLTLEQSQQMVDYFYKIHNIKNNIELKHQIAFNSKGNILAIKRSVQQLAKGEIPEITQHGAIKDDAVNLYPIFLLFAFILIGMKYLLRTADDYEMANLAGFFGIVVFFCIRFLWFRLR